MFFDPASTFSAAVWALGLAISMLFAMPAHAVRTSVFPSEVTTRAAVWLDQDRIFGAETGSQRNRPIWVQGGDSLATAWANGPSLRDLLKRAETSEIPEALSLPDYLSHIPDAARTWYAGKNFGFGLLGSLDRKSGLGEWVVISTALAGAKISPDPPGPWATLAMNSPGAQDDDSLKLLTRVAQPERVKLVTFSLGSNDACINADVLKPSYKLNDRLAALRAAYPNAALVPMRVAPVQKFHDAIFARLRALPESPGRTRVMAYCLKAWASNCPEATKGTASQAGAVSQIIENAIAAQLGVELFDQFQVVDGVDVLDVIGSDCFHPSAQTEERLVGPLSEFVQRRLN